MCTPTMECIPLQPEVAKCRLNEVNKGGTLHNQSRQGANPPTAFQMIDD